MDVHFILTNTVDLFVGTIGQACHRTHQFTPLVVNLHLIIRYFVVVQQLTGFSSQHIARQCMVKKRDCAFQAERQLSATIHHSGQGQVGQGEHRATLTDTTCIKVVAADGHLRQSVAITDFCNLCPSMKGKYITVVEEILKEHY